MSSDVPKIRRLEVLIGYWTMVEEMHQTHYQRMQDFLADSSKTTYLNDTDLRGMHDMCRVLARARRMSANLRASFARSRSAAYRNPLIIWPPRE